jgi:hypothetical protein
MDDHVPGMREARVGESAEKKESFFVVVIACLDCEKHRWKARFEHCGWKSEFRNTHARQAKLVRELSD